MPNSPKRIDSGKEKDKTMSATTDSKAVDKGSDKGAVAKVADVQESVIFAPLAAIHVDYDWNVRSKADVENEDGDGVQDEGKPASGGLAVLTANIHDQGQDTPVILAAVKDGKTLNGTKTDKKFELIAGFRRITAISNLNAADKVAERATGGDKRPAVKDVPDGHIKAIVKSFASAREARIVNTRENTLRSNLKAPDMVRLVAELSATNGAKGLTQTEIGSLIGIHQGYVSKLGKVATLPPAVLNHWRLRTAIPGITAKSEWKQLSIIDMEELSTIAKGLSVGEVIERYVGLLDGVKKETAKRDPNKGIEEKLGQVGYFIGSLVAQGIIAPGTLAWGAAMGPEKAGYLLDSGSKEVSRERKNELIDILSGQYARALEDAKKTKPVAEG